MALRPRISPKLPFRCNEIPPSSILLEKAGFSSKNVVLIGLEREIASDNGGYDKSLSVSPAKISLSAIELGLLFDE